MRGGGVRDIVSSMMGTAEGALGSFARHVGVGSGRHSVVLEFR